MSWELETLVYRGTDDVSDRHLPVWLVLALPLTL